VTKSDWRRVELLAAEREHNRQLRLIVAVQAILIAAGFFAIVALLFGRLPN